MMLNSKEKNIRATINCILVLFVFFFGLLCRFNASSNTNYSALSETTCSLRLNNSPLSPVLFTNIGNKETHINHFYYIGKKSCENTTPAVSAFHIIASFALILQILSFLSFQIDFINKNVKQKLSVIIYIHKSDGHKSLISF